MKIIFRIVGIVLFVLATAALANLYNGIIGARFIGSIAAYLFTIYIIFWWQRMMGKTE